MERTLELKTFNSHVKISKKISGKESAWERLDNLIDSICEADIEQEVEKIVLPLVDIENNILGEFFSLFVVINVLCVSDEFGNVGNTYCPDICTFFCNMDDDIPAGIVLWGRKEN